MYYPCGGSIGNVSRWFVGQLECMCFGFHERSPRHARQLQRVFRAQHYSIHGLVVSAIFFFKSYCQFVDKGGRNHEHWRQARKRKMLADAVVLGVVGQAVLIGAGSKAMREMDLEIHGQVRVT